MPMMMMIMPMMMMIMPVLLDVVVDGVGNTDLPSRLLWRFKGSFRTDLCYQRG